MARSFVKGSQPLIINFFFFSPGSWGKRDPAWNNLKGLWGKRSVDSKWAKLQMGWGKRSTPGK